MLRCDKCGVNVRGARERCPLCQNPLIGKKETAGDPFPQIPPEPQPYHFFLRLMVFLSVAAVVVCMAVNAMFPIGVWWSVFVAGGIGCLWLSLAFVIRKLGNIPKTILWQVAVISLLAVLWDWFTGWRGWSIDYVLPILYMCAMISLGVLGKILKQRISDYMIYMMMDALFGFLPLLFLLLGWVKVVYPSVICVAGCILSLAGLLTFQGEKMRAELKRRMHV